MLMWPTVKMSLTPMISAFSCNQNSIPIYNAKINNKLLVKNLHSRVSIFRWRRAAVGYKPFFVWLLLLSSWWTAASGQSEGSTALGPCQWEQRTSTSWTRTDSVTAVYKLAILVFGRWPFFRVTWWYIQSRGAQYVDRDRPVDRGDLPVDRGVVLVDRMT